MFKRVITHKGFLKSVFILGLIYAIILLFLQWAMFGFSTALFSEGISPLFIITLLGAGLFCGFMVSFGKFWGKLKREDYKNQ
ncbi:hypothetical protein ACFQO1_03645 [Jejudonia soesokkakensis]|uniref:Uncharacterized protein n=1 Tax=Jejudonia soesokkakensis TaxID=1323432 RepID=A0ABW2MR03_9FLAO